ncbi:LacI family DNA-binding transcriptional regulator [Kushneria indalinina]|uniref:LacI family transcriptional regulator n=1 Tax=Kushneria indalinina DSM 14324 TaxID=1122140 RepID=A0A3D9DWY7_9GAMM|nr:LacI family DNA-binding transcriptional regulator [Kushneria indalinina]REC95288.1 LacI family transcriptional regulator [Kushneria indalinina DSM 14324]
MPTIREVAARAGVSPATVSRVMKGEVRVNAETRARVEAVIKALGYAPNVFARSLASNRLNGVGLVISHLGGPFMGRVMMTLEAALRRANVSLLVASGGGEAGREQEAVDFLLGRRCDGLIVHADALSNATLAGLAATTPLVVFNRRVPEIAEHCIHLDNECGGYLATRHLLEQGHRRIACLTGPLKQQDAAERLAGYRRALREEGIETDEHAIIEGDFTERSGEQGMATLLAREAAVTAVVAGNDDMALGAMAALRARRISMPQTISLIGYDDEACARHVVPALTTVHAPLEEMAQAAAERLLALIEGATLPPSTPFMPTLIERETVAAPGG